MTETVVDARQLTRLLRTAFSDGRAVRLAVTGHSMRPFLRDRRDAVVLLPPERRAPAPGEIVLFFRDSGACVLHRIVSEREDGSFLVCGDAQTQTETVRRDQVAAVVCAVVRRGRCVPCDAGSYRLCAAAWEFLRPVRGAFVTMDKAAYHVVQTLGKKGKGR